MDESLVKYLAGLLDADGSLSFQFRLGRNKEDQYYLSLTLALHSSRAVDRHGFVHSLPGLTGFGEVYEDGTERQFYKWLVSRRAHLEMLLPRLIKHMAVKARHWQWLLETWRGLRGDLVSIEKRDALRVESKLSRLTRKGPLKPKNHPTWAWLAGFLDGDGWYTHKRTNAGSHKDRRYESWRTSVGAVAHREDAHVLDFIMKAHGGRIEEHGQTDTVLRWVRPLGISNRDFALEFLRQLVRHARLKRHKIETILAHHSQRLSVPAPEGEAIV